MKCAYCGEEMKRRTKDHIISRGFFPSTLSSSSKLITCKCCPECQEDKANCENYILTSVRLDEKSMDYPGGEELSEKAIRALSRRNRGLVQQVNQSLTWEWQTFNGIEQYIPVGIRPLKNELEKFLEYLTKGMYFHMTREIMPCHMKVETFIPLLPQRIPYPFRRDDAELINIITECIRYGEYVECIGDGIFMCIMKTVLNERKDKTISMFIFLIRGRASITLMVPNDLQFVGN